MSTNPKGRALIMRGESGPAGAEQRLKELGIQLPAPPEPFGTYVEAVQSGNLLFLSGMTSGDVREQPKVADALRSCCETSSERTRVLVAWCMESQAFRSAPRSSWK